MKTLRFTAATLALMAVSGSFAPAFAQNNFDYRTQLPYRQDYRREVRGPVYFSEGDIVPKRYLAGEFLVRDWYGNNLDRPPRGAQWVRVNNQFIMVSLNNGTAKKVV